MKSLRKSKNFLILPKYQMNHALFTLGLVLMTNAVFAYLVLLYIQDFFTEGSINNLQSLKNDLIFFITMIFIVSSLVLGLLVIIMNIIHTHRVFGSIRAIELYLIKVIEGKAPGLLSVRSNDQSGEMVNLINKLVKLYHQNRTDPQ